MEQFIVDAMQKRPKSKKPIFVKSALSVYWIAAFLRIVLTLLPQTGYIHPDEFFQNVEILLGDIFGVEDSRPWEFKVSYPVRSISVPYLILGGPLYVLKAFGEFFELNLRNPYLFLVIPRLVFCCLSFVTDYSLYKICCLEEEDFRVRLLILSTSYVMTVFATHTFSNSVELALVSFLIYHVIHCMKATKKTISTCESLSAKFLKIENMREKIQIARQLKKLPSYQYQGCFILSAILVFGVFNRPTFLCFALPSVFCWLYRGMGSQNVSLYHFHIRLICLALCALPLTCLCILADSMYFGKLTLHQVMNHNVYVGYSFVVAPYNFFKYNMDSKNLAKHGIHPRFTHALVNVPLLYNVLAGVALVSLSEIYVRIQRQQWSLLPHIQSTYFVMLLSLVCPVLTLSMFPHQEARFLIPITLPMIYLFSHKIYDSTWGMQQQSNGSYTFSQKTPSGGVQINKRLIRIWFILNMLLTMLFGFTHQAGVYSLVKRFSEEVSLKPPGTDIHLVTSHSYSLPISLMGIPNYKNTLFLDKQGKKYRKSQDFFVFELGSSSMRHLCKRISNILDESEGKKKDKKVQYKLYLALPGSRYEEFITYSEINSFEVTTDSSIFPHITMEALPRINVPNVEGQCMYSSIWQTPVDIFVSLVEQSKIVVLRIRKRPKVLFKK